MFKNIFALVSFFGSLFVLFVLLITKRQSMKSVELIPIRVRSKIGR